MSVYGGDSWAREAQHRKRRIDDLMIEGVQASVYKKLSSGKFVCFVCPHNPVFDTSVMLTTHVNGSRHQAVWRSKEKELAIQGTPSVCVYPNVADNVTTKQRKIASKPLIERVRKAASEVISGNSSHKEVKSASNSIVMACGKQYSHIGNSMKLDKRVIGDVQPLDYGKNQEMELKFTAAGWKRDCHGGWFKDNSVEFDSDEEDPNIVLKSALGKDR